MWGVIDQGVYLCPPPRWLRCCLLTYVHSSVLLPSHKSCCAHNGFPVRIAVAARLVAVTARAEASQSPSSRRLMLLPDRNSFNINNRRRTRSSSNSGYSGNTSADCDSQEDNRHGRYQDPSSGQAEGYDGDGVRLPFRGPRLSSRH